MLSRLGQRDDEQERSTPRSTSRLRGSDLLYSIPGSQRVLEKQWELAAGPAVKLEIADGGYHRVDGGALLALGLDRLADPRLLQLFVEGQQVPIVVRGEEDGRLDASDVIEFYGAGLDTPWTARRVYWLVVGSQRGRRLLTEAAGGQPAGPPPGSFPVTVERKERRIYFAALRNGDGENFFGRVVAGEAVDQVLRTQRVEAAAAEEALLEVSLQGVTESRHQVDIRFNGMKAGEADFQGQVGQVTRVTVPHTWVREGDNVVTLARQGDETDVSLVDYVRLTYHHRYAADGNELWLTAAAGEQVTVEGFTTEQVCVLDVTDTDAVTELARNVARAGDGFAVTVVVPGGEEREQRRLYLFSEERVRQPAAMRWSAGSAWHRQSGADIVMISDGRFLNALEPLKALREQQGWSVALVDIEDVYDEYAFGEKTPWAVRTFLMQASAQWSRPPRFALLAGDASFDPRNYLGLGDFDLVPTKLVDTEILETASDDWFGDLDGDGVPEVVVGRLPVRTAAEAAAVVAKLIGYEQELRTGDWDRTVLLISDKNDGVSDFEKLTAGVSSQLPLGLRIQKILLSDTGGESTRRDLLTQLNEGQLLVNYIGHGSQDVWSSQGVFTGADAEVLSNASRLPVVLSMTCLNGFFHDVYGGSLAEALLKAEGGGAVAVWTSSGLTSPAAQMPINEALVRLLFNNPGLTLGDAVAMAKEASKDADVRRTWILFGDPAMKLNVPVLRKRRLP